MPIQVRLEADPHPFIAVRAARRTGKSTGVLFIVLIRCLERADSRWVVVGLTRGSIKRIYWDPLKKLNTAFELGVKFQHQLLTATLQNGSVIEFVGAENAAEIDKLRGSHYHGAVIDECKSYAPLVFKELVDDVLTAALLQNHGQLYIIGTPGDHLEGPFYLATAEEPVLTGSTDSPELRSNAIYGSPVSYPYVWSLHAWSLQDNLTRFPDPRTGQTQTLWEMALAMKALNGWSDDNPTWRREFLGHWVANDAKRVYRYHSWRNDYIPCADTLWGLPGNIDTRLMRTVIGWDLGSKDGTAVVVWAWSPDTRDLWELHSERRYSTPENPLNVSALARWYHELDDQYGPFEGFPCDPAGLATMVMETLATEHGVLLEPAEKKEKNDFIELMNNDFDAGYIHIRKGSELSEELIANRWLDKSLGLDHKGRITTKERRKEDPAIPNDVADAGLYAFRWCRHRQFRPLDTQPQLYSQAWWAQVAKAELAAAEARARAQHDADGVLDLPWWEDEPRRTEIVS